MGLGKLGLPGRGQCAKKSPGTGTRATWMEAHVWWAAQQEGSDHAVLTHKNLHKEQEQPGSSPWKGRNWEQGPGGASGSWSYMHNAHKDRCTRTG